MKTLIRAAENIRKTWEKQNLSHITIPPRIKTNKADMSNLRPEIAFLNPYEFDMPDLKYILKSGPYKVTIPNFFYS